MKKNQQTKKRKKIVYDLISCKEYQPMRAKELAVLLQVPAGKRDQLHEILDMLLEEGKITVNKRGRYEAVRTSNKKEQEKKEAQTTDSAAEPGKEEAGVGAYESYTIQFGDSLYKISTRKYGTMDMIPEICRLNGISTEDIIYPGQKILLP